VYDSISFSNNNNFSFAFFLVCCQTSISTLSSILRNPPECLDDFYSSVVHFLAEDIPNHPHTYAVEKKIQKLASQIESCFVGISTVPALAFCIYMMRWAALWNTHILHDDGCFRYLLTMAAEIAVRPGRILISCLIVESSKNALCMLRSLLRDARRTQAEEEGFSGE